MRSEESGHLCSLHGNTRINTGDLPILVGLGAIKETETRTNAGEAARYLCKGNGECAWSNVYTPKVICGRSQYSLILFSDIFTFFLIGIFSGLINLVVWTLIKACYLWQVLPNRDRINLNRNVEHSVYSSYIYHI